MRIPMFHPQEVSQSLRQRDMTVHTPWQSEIYSFFIWKRINSLYMLLP